MKNYKQYIFAGLTLLSLSLTSCDDFLDTAPNDALTPSKTWKTESDVNKFLTGCYDFFQPAISLVYWDAGSDFGYNNFPWEGFTCIGNGTMTPSNPGARPDPAWRGGYMDLYDFQTIRRCNTLLANVDKATFSSEAVKKDMVAQCRFIRAYRYFVMTNRYGGVPIIDNYSTAQEAQVPRSSEADVHKYIKDELAAVIADINTVPTQRGRAGKGAALALKMRLALYESDWATAKEAAQAIIDLGQYSLESNYATLFQVAGQDSKEIILASQQESNNYAYDWSFYFPNSVGGWSSVVPTQQCVDNYEMANGMTIDESGSGYDPTHPYHGRDPRLSATIIYPGCDWSASMPTPLTSTPLWARPTCAPSSSAMPRCCSHGLRQRTSSTVRRPRSTRRSTKCASVPECPPLTARSTTPRRACANLSTASAAASLPARASAAGISWDGRPLTARCMPTRCSTSR